MHKHCSFSVDPHLFKLFTALLLRNWVSCGVMLCYLLSGSQHFKGIWCLPAPSFVRSSRKNRWQREVDMCRVCWLSWLELGKNGKARGGVWMGPVMCGAVTRCVVKELGTDQWGRWLNIVYVCVYIYIYVCICTCLPCLALLMDPTAVEAEGTVLLCHSFTFLKSWLVIW